MLKVVQRIAVRIAFDKSQCDQLRRVGMSAVTAVDAGHRRRYRRIDGLGTAISQPHAAHVYDSKLA